MANLSLIKKPLITEKATTLEPLGQYVFEVLGEATKPEVKKAIEKLYSVHVKRVTMIQLPPKTRRYRGLKRSIAGRKKAVVILKAGEKINF
ncbi:MAG: 50S ribosomal protein L23 [Patescibacteria group bacterium]